MNAELTLYQRNYVRNCHCDFVTQSAAPGPSVFVFCRGEDSVQSTGPHQRWATATLFDNVKINGAGIELINRNTMGSGQGWAGANMVTWNCRSDWSDVESPPTAQNWAIGAVAPIRRNKYGPGRHIRFVRHARGNSQLIYRPVKTSHGPAKAGDGLICIFSGRQRQFRLQRRIRHALHRPGLEGDCRDRHARHRFGHRF